jgi:alpha-L-rhamnosidase
VIRFNITCIVAVFLSILQSTLALPAHAQAPATVSVANLRCEYRTDPLGIGVAKPRLSWTISSEQRGQRQTAYQILVASSVDALAKDQGDLWDSGKVTSDATSQVEYAGVVVQSGAACHWKVRSWDKDGQPSVWSNPALWTMGLMKPEDWQAKWIGYDAAYNVPAEQAKDDATFNIQGLKWVRFPEKQAIAGKGTLFLRKQFDLPTDRKVRRALAVVYAFNHCDVAVNGVAIGQAMHWEPTARLDATAALHAGANVITMAVEQTDHLPPAVIGKFVVQFESGADRVMPIDRSWRATQQMPAQVVAPEPDHALWATAEALDGTPWRGAPPLGDVARVPAPYLRKSFTVDQSIKRATVYVTALGVYELHINGKRVGQDELTPGWTDFHKRVYSQTYDVTGQVRQGENAIGAILGDGWYAGLLAHLGHREIYGGRPRLLVQLVIERADGSNQTIVTDESWKAAYGPIRHADLLLGSEYDARLEMPGWDTAGFNDAAWNRVLTDGTAAKKPGSDGMIVEPAIADACRRFEELPAKKITEPRPGCWTFDLGQNMVGWVRLKVRGSAGQRITVRHGEMLNPDGTLYTANLRSATAADFYELAGKGEETFEPYFTFHGFRYVEVRGLTEKPALDAVTGTVVHSAMTRTGTFECSAPLVNQLYSNIIWGQKGNHLEIPTDCPQRDERMGWTGDTQFFAATGAYNFDVDAFFSRWLVTMCEDSQFPNGSFPHVVPDIMGGGGATGWSDAAIICTYNIYHVYGDTRIISDHYAALDRYMQFVASKTDHFISHLGGFEDWLNLGGGADGRVIDTAYYAYLAQLMSEMAKAIGKDADAQRYATLHDNVKAAFQQAFIQPDGSLKGCSQTGYALAFSMGLLPESSREKTAEKFVGEIKRFDWHLATGFIGTPRLMPALHEAGRDDIAYKLLLQETYPSWLFQVKLGATTMWERWNGWTPDGGFGDVSMNSFNHYAFGSVGEYLYSTVGGISAASAGYNTIRIQPVFGDGITWANTSFDSIHGPIATRWKHEGDSFTLDVTIPANTTATVYVPARDAAAVLESGKPAADSPGVKLLSGASGSALFQVQSGTYHFVSQKL